MSHVEFLQAWPEITLLFMACVLLVMSLFGRDGQSGTLHAVALATLAACGVVAALAETGEPMYLFHGMFVSDAVGNLLKLACCGTVAAVIVYSRGYIAERRIPAGEFLALTLFATLGMMVMISASHLLSAYLGLELLSLSLYALVALQRDDSAGTEAAMKYFILGALASGMLLYGMSMVYGGTGTLSIPEVAARVAAGQAREPVLMLGLVFVVAGLAFKLGAVPFHMWVPDVYQGAPTAVTLLVSTAPKLAAYAFVIRLLVEALGAPALVAQWQPMLVMLAVLSMAVGNITAIAQTNLKRMLAYSTISHMGFLLLGILAGTVDGYAAALFYVVVYAAVGLGTFGMILLLSREGFEADRLEDFRGLNRRSPWYAFLMLLLMFSLAGVPPTVGFHAKLAVLEALVQAGHAWLAVVAVLLSLVGAFYYLRVVRLMYFDEPADRAPLRRDGPARLLLSLNGLAALAVGLLPGWLMTLCQRALQASL